jgi:hypothetical protein
VGATPTSNPGSKITIRLREADKLKRSLASAPSSTSLSEREARLKKREKLDNLRGWERHLSAGVTLILGEPDIADLITADPKQPDEAAECVAGFVEEYLRPDRGHIDQSWTKYVIFPKGRSNDLYGWIYLTAKENRQYSSHQAKLLAKWNNLSLLNLFWELPDDIRLSKGIPAAVNAILRAVQDGKSLDYLRREKLMEIVSWEIGDD